ncbi:cellulase family glycosylhydrolase, partial [bacterium]|nr:cellulase family glycosylhydrolase [bacterium]
KESGSFLVQLVLASPVASAGSDYAVEVAGETFVRTVPDTGGWDKFVPFQLGVVDLEGGTPYTVAVRFKEKRSGALMNLQSVTFRGGDWPRGLAAWWRFDEGSGAETRDALTEQADAIQFARWTWGMSGTGIRLNGFTSEVTRAAAAVPKVSEALTIEAWVKLLAPPEGWSPIINQHTYPTGFYFGFDGSGALGLHLSMGGAWRSCISAVAPPLGQWAHVAATFDSTSGARIYLNGVETGHLYGNGVMTQAEGDDLVIGKNNHHPWSLNAVVDEVRLYRRALSEREVRRHYTSTPRPLSPPPIALEAACADRDSATIHERVTLEVGLLATYDNPFDSDDVRVDAAIVSPSGRKWTVPGFLYQPFERGLGPDEIDPKIEKETLEPAGQSRWQVRMSFAEPGVHRVTVTATDRTGTVTAEPITITAQDADVPGPIRRHGLDSRYFVTERGETFFPIGANVCWAGPRGTLDYDEWLATYAENGCNVFRVWLSPQWPTLALNTVSSGFDRIDLGNAWRFDHVLETAEELGLRVLPCIDSFNILRAVERVPGNMEDAPYVRANGGPIVKPLDYFTHEASLKAYRDRLRYIVARYGYSPNILAWEFWNEVDIIDGYDSATVTAWHETMARHLRGIDPWARLIGTSHAMPKGDPAVDALPELDFVQTHTYDAKDMARQFDDHRKQKAAAKNRPHLHGEFGIGHDGKKTAETDPTGIHLRNALFS